MRANVVIFLFIWLFFLICIVDSAEAQLQPANSVPGEYLVKFKSRIASTSFKASRAFSTRVTVKKQFEDSELVHVIVDSEIARKTLYENPDIEFIEPNFILSLHPVAVGAEALPVPDAENYNQSRGGTQVPESWAIQRASGEGTKAIVAVIDTGLDKMHPVFKESGAIWENKAEINGLPGKDDDNNGYVDDKHGWDFTSNRPDYADDNGHGTHVAGIVLGVGLNIFSSPIGESKIKIMALKFIDSSGSGTASSAVSAIHYAVRNGAKVINSSWAGPSYSRALEEAYIYAYHRGVVIVSAAGNSNSNNDVAAVYPASFATPNNISVLATSDDDVKAWFSNYGVAKVSVAAPGEAILSAVPNKLNPTAGSFQYMSGSSMAAPFVAGLAALIFRESPQLTAFQVKKIILESVDVVPALVDKAQAGGRVNAYNAIVLAVSAGEEHPYKPGYEISPTNNGAALFEQPNAGCGLVKNAGAGGEHNKSARLLLLLLPFFIAYRLRSSRYAVRAEPLTNLVNSQ